MRKIFLTVYLCFTLAVIFAVDISPKREVRGAWLSTVGNIDWPVSKYDSDAKKKSDLKNFLIKLKACGLNTVFFQVRPACDAMYKSSIEPWSFWFSGVQGKGPESDWDPLEYAIKEAHKLGMELHAWVNPYRAVFKPTSTNLKNINYLSHGHVSNVHPEWLLKSSGVYILNPGIPEVREYILSVFMDIVSRYDVDGLHIDDYFYFYLTDEDAATFTQDPRGIANIKDWRRDNVNVLIKSVHDSIQIIKPWVKWGVSPTPGWKPNQPEGVVNGTYNTSFCDPVAWLEAKSVDYIIPQNYYNFDSYLDYGNLVTWWSDKAVSYGRHCYSGQALYKANTWDEGEITSQMDYNRAEENCHGQVFFTAHNFNDNYKHSVDSLKELFFSKPALWPLMDWKNNRKPLPVNNLNVEYMTNGKKKICWENPLDEVSGDTVFGNVIYRSAYPLEEISDNTHIYKILFQESEYTDNSIGNYYYALTSLNRYKQESEMIRAYNPFVRQLQPEYGDGNCEIDQTIKWHSRQFASFYHLRIVEEGKDFDVMLLDTIMTDTSIDLSLKHDYKYYWQVKADRDDEWSPTWNFTCAPAPQVNPLFPKNFTESCDSEPLFKWNKLENAAFYEIRISVDESMLQVFFDVDSISDTTYQIPFLDLNAQYYWQVRSSKYESWSKIFRFRTYHPEMQPLWENTRIAGTYPDSFKNDLSLTGLAVGTYNGNEIVLVVQNNDSDFEINTFSADDGKPLELEINVEGVSGGLYALRDIEFSEDGVIYASNCVNTGGDFRVYQWVNPQEAPELVYEANNVAYRLGDHITVTGRYDHGTITVFAPGAKSDKMLKLEWNSVAASFDANQITLARGNNYNPCMAALPGSDEFYLTSNEYYLRHFASNGENIDWMKGNLNMPVNANAIESFAYLDKLFIAAYVADSEAAHVVDVSDGVSTALKAGKTYRMGVEENTRLFGDIEVIENGEGSFDIYVLGNQNGLAAYRFDAASAVVSIDDDIPKFFELGQNYPNPFNPISTIPYALNSDMEIEINLYNIKGALVRTLYSGLQIAGNHRLSFNASDLTSGVYILKMRAENDVVARKVTLLK